MWKILKMKNKINFNKLDIPLSFRVPHVLHKKYKFLSGFERKKIQFKFVEWLDRQLDKSTFSFEDNTVSDIVQDKKGKTIRYKNERLMEEINE